MKTNKDVKTVSKRRKKWLSSKVLNPKSCAKNRFIYSDETVWTGAMVKLGISHWEAAVPAGAEAQVPPPPRAAPRRAAPPLAGAPRPPPIGYDARARPTRATTWPPFDGEPYINSGLPSPHHSSSGCRRVNVHVSSVPNTNFANTTPAQFCDLIGLILQ